MPKVVRVSGNTGDFDLYLTHANGAHGPLYTAFEEDAAKFDDPPEGAPEKVTANALAKQHIETVTKRWPNKQFQLEVADLK